MTTINVQTPLHVAAPRAARWAAFAFTGMLRWFERRQVAGNERREGVDRVAEASAVRAYALRFASHDPRFAADLLAAADRHERGG